MPINLDELMLLESQKREQKRILGNVVTALMQKMSINAEDNGLVCFIDNCYATNNKMAISNWALKELAKMDINPEISDSVINRLEYSLTRLINRKMGN
jgi:hypothetical protein